MIRSPTIFRAWDVVSRLLYLAKDIQSPSERDTAVSIKVDSSGGKVSSAQVGISLAAARVGSSSSILPVLVKRFEQFAQAMRAGESRQLAHFAIIHVVTSRTARALFATYLRLSYEWLLSQVR